MSEYSIEELYIKVDKLLARCRDLQADNDLLKSREQQWLQEKSQLLVNNDEARHRVEAMIVHLKDLQQGVG